MTETKFRPVMIKELGEKEGNDKWQVVFNHGEAFSNKRAYIIARCRTSREAFATALCHMASSLMYGQNVDTWQVSVRQIQDNIFILRCTYDYPNDDDPELDYFEYDISPLVYGSYNEERKLVNKDG